LGARPKLGSKKNTWMFPLSLSVSATPHAAASCPLGAARRQRRAPLRERQAGRAGRRRARQGSVTPCAGRRSLEPRPAPRVQGRRRQQCSAAVGSLGARLRRAEPGHRVAAVRQVAAGGASAVGAADAAAQRTRGRGGGAGNERGYGDELGEGDHARGLARRGACAGRGVALVETCSVVASRLSRRAQSSRSWRPSPRDDRARRDKRDGQREPRGRGRRQLAKSWQPSTLCTISSVFLSNSLLSLCPSHLGEIGVSRPRERSTAGPVSYTWAARSG